MRVGRDGSRRGGCDGGGGIGGNQLRLRAFGPSLSSVAISGSRNAKLRISAWISSNLTSIASSLDLVPNTLNGINANMIARKSTASRITR
ncbi:MAG: hypothetical protein EOP89_13230 [Lysobacteraceae bacterium]|nr:MAG: hypothetical protein EOP89_13230 [Xanthomonadaceae bacterium]